MILAALLASASPPVMVKYAGVALDPAGTRIASIDSEQVRGAPTAMHGILVIRDTAGRVIARYDPCEACAYDAPAWSPDGRQLAFVAGRAGVATLYVLEGGALRKVTSVRGLAAAPRWSADGRRIAFLATVDATKLTGATQPGVRQVGVIGTHEDSRRIAVVPVTGGAYRLVSPEGVFVYEYDWQPDGRGFVGTAAEGNGDNQWWVATLRGFAIDGAMRTIAAPAMQMNFPRVSPDGRSVAFIGGLMSDFPVVGGDAYLVDLTGGKPIDLTPDARLSITSLAWRGARLIAGVTQGGSTGVATVDPAARRMTGLAVAAETIAAGDGAVAPDRSGARAAFVSEGFDHAPRLMFGPVGAARAISHDNDALRPIAVARDIRWKNEGLDVQGWLLAPVQARTTAKEAPDEPPAKRPPAKQPPARQPMVTIVHGGPSSAATPKFLWGDVNAALITRGTWLFQPNPRGSFGQGEAFVRANVKDFGGGDLRDILAGIDAVEREAPIDDARLGIYGHSYGGFMAMWTVTHSRRFKAAVAGAGIANWVSYYGQNGIDQWMIPFFGASVYDDPQVYDRLSPVRSIRQAKTPTLLYVGERDVETPAAQSLEFWHALKAVGVPTELVIYQDQGHGITDPAALADRDRRLVGWFDRWLGAPR